MTAPHELPSLLWVGKAPVNGGGDEIYDRKVLAVLGRHYRITRFAVPIQPIVQQVRALLSGVPHPRFRYANRSTGRLLATAAKRHDYVVISHEAFEYFGRYIDRPITLVIHNVAHDILNQLYPARLFGRVAAAQSQRWECDLYARDAIRLVTLSRRDQALVQSLAPGRPVVIACPGLPPLTRLTNRAVIAELVLSGSYDWHPKRRDLIALAAEVAVQREILAWRHDLPLPEMPATAPIASVSRQIDAADYGQGIRFGVIPDRFLGGFKLKATYFIANNCVVLSRCDIRAEFAGLPFADQFVRYTPHIADIDAAIAELGAADGETVCDQWLIFQAACAERFSWQSAANAVCGSD